MGTNYSTTMPDPDPAGVDSSDHQLLDQIPEPSDTRTNRQCIEMKLQLKKISTKIEEHHHHPEDTSVKIESISIPYPKTCKQLKKHIEEHVHIPVALQTLYHRSHIISDTEPSLECYHFRDQETIRVEYTEQALVQEIDLILEIIRHGSEFLETNHKTILKPDWPPEFTAEVKAIFSQAREVERLVKEYFTPHTAATTNANRVYFVHHGGLESTFSLQRNLASLPWTCMSFEMQCMERVALSIFWNLSATLGIRCLILDQPGFINSICKSITRQKIVDGKPIIAPAKQRATISNPFVLNMPPSSLLIDTMFKGMGVITNLSEVPSCQLQIASKEKVMQQMATAMLSQSLNIFTAHIIISAFLNLSYDPNTHPYLTTPPVLEGILRSCEKHANQIYTQHDADVVLLKYYTTLFFSLVCSLSDHFSQCKSFDLYAETVLEFIIDFLQTYRIEEVLRIEMNADYFWSTLKPFVNMVYFGYEQKINSNLVKEKPLLHELYSESLKAAIFCLTVVCTRGSDCIDVLEKENQIDYIVCLPWFVDGRFKKEAQVMVDKLSSQKRLAPPTLQNIAKARLSTVCGIPPSEILMTNIFDIHRKLYKN